MYHIIYINHLVEQLICGLSPTRACSRYTPAHSRLLTPHTASSTAACRLCRARLPAELRCALHGNRLLLNLFSAGSAMLPTGPDPETRSVGLNVRSDPECAATCSLTEDKFSPHASTVSRSAARAHPGRPSRAATRNQLTDITEH